jgi:hypothetical protein
MRSTAQVASPVIFAVCQRKCKWCDMCMHDARESERACTALQATGCGLTRQAYSALQLASPMIVADRMRKCEDVVVYVQMCATSACVRMSEVARQQIQSKPSKPRGEDLHSMRSWRCRWRPRRSLHTTEGSVVCNQGACMYIVGESELACTVLETTGSLHSMRYRQCRWCPRRSSQTARGSVLVCRVRASV